MAASETSDCPPISHAPGSTPGCARKKASTGAFPNTAAAASAEMPRPPTATPTGTPSRWISPAAAAAGSAAAAVSRRNRARTGSTCSHKKAIAISPCTLSARSKRASSSAASRGLLAAASNTSWNPCRPTRTVAAVWGVWGCLGVGGD